MTTIERHLDEAIVEWARRVAAAHDWTFEELFEAALEGIDRYDSVPYDPLWGVFADEEEVLDQLIEETMQARENYALRVNDAESNS